MNKKILLVDDEEDIRDVLSISLADSGYHVETAANGDEAFDKFLAERYPVILCDIKMPGMDGIELLQKLKAEDPETEVIMVTGHGDMELAIRSLKYEATDFVTKPIYEDVLEIALKRAFERISMRRQIREYTENLEKLVEEKTRQLLDAERMAAVGETVAGLAHAIKNIAGGLKGGMFVLEKGIELDNRKYLEDGWRMIKGNVDKIKNMSLDLLNFAKSSALNLKRMNPNEPVQEVADLLADQAKSFDIDLEIDLDSGLEPILFDPEAVYRCILNLAANALDACKYDEIDGERKKVSIRTVKPADWAVEYRISDNGMGMDAETRSRIFQSFFSTKGTKGTGIGLMMTAKTVDRHNGAIDVISEKGKGSTFIIRLPESPDKPAPEPPR